MQEILAISFAPLVNSIIPDKNGTLNGYGILNTVNNGCNNFAQYSNKTLFSRIDSITENKTTKPPIKTIVLIEFIILVAITSPRFDKLTVCFFILENPF